MNASSLHRMALGKEAIQGGSHAQRTLYRHQQGCPRTRSGADRKTCRPQETQRQMYRRRTAARVVRGGGSTDLAVCRLCPDAEGTVARNGSADAVGYLAQLRQTA